MVLNIINQVTGREATDIRNLVWEIPVIYVVSQWLLSGVSPVKAMENLLNPSVPPPSNNNI